MSRPSKIKVRYQNVQNWTQNKHQALVTHLTNESPDIIIFTSSSRTTDQGPIKIPNYNTFITNKQNVRHVGSGIAVKNGIQFEVINNFHHDTIGAKVLTSQGQIVILTSYAPPRQNFLPNQDLEYMMRNPLPTIFAGDLNTRHQTFG